MRKTLCIEEAVAKIPDGASLMIGGFMAVGTPVRLIDELVRQNKKNLTVIANDTAKPGVGIGKLIAARLVRRVVMRKYSIRPMQARANTRDVPRREVGECNCSITGTCYSASKAHRHMQGE